MTISTKDGSFYLNKNLSKVFPNHRDNILLCPQCLPDNNQNVVAYRDRFSSGYDRIQRLCCTICKASWYVCEECSNQRSHYSIDDAIRHIRMKHRSGTTVLEHVLDDNLNETHTAPYAYSDEDSHGTDEHRVVSMPDTDMMFPHCTQQQDAYFRSNEAMLKGDFTYGLRCLVANAMHKSMDKDFIDGLSYDHVMFHSHIALLSSKLTPMEKQHLCKSFSHLANLFSNGVPIDKYLIPCHINDLNRRYLKSKFSFMKNLPRPEVKTMCRHGYISLKSCVADLLGRHNMAIDEITLGSQNSVRTISQSRRAQDFIKKLSELSDLGLLVEPNKQRLILHIVEWSDDFDPAKSIKDNRGSAWIKTVTIGGGPALGKEFFNTYVISIGKKNDSHEEVEAEFAKDLAELRTGNLQFRLGKYGILVYVYADIVAALQDQIERRSMNYLMLGKSTYSARWGYSCDFSGIKTKLPYCAQCWKEILAGSLLTQACDHCFGWNTEDVCFAKPLKYPKSVPTSDENILRCKPITYESLSRSVTTAIEGMLRTENKWTKEMASSYLSTECINGELLELVYKHVKKVRAARKHSSEEPLWKDPVLWSRGVPLSCHLDAPMHLLFLGIVKATIVTINEWMSGYGYDIILQTRTNATLGIIDNLNLNWCRAVPQWTAITSRCLTTAGWVSENYLAMTRLAAWYYSECIESTLFDEADEYIALSMLLTSLRAMIARIMAVTVDGEKIDDVHQHIKLFLQCYHDFTNSTSLFSAKVENRISGRKRKRRKQDVMVTATEKKQMKGVSIGYDNNATTRDRESHTYGTRIKANPPWIEKYNFMCLLNIPDVMRLFGPIRNFWEGGMMGEKVLRFAKRTWHGFTANWATNMLTSVNDIICAKKTLFDVLSSYDREGDCNDVFPDENFEANNNTHHERSCYHIYKSTDHVLSVFKAGIPISLIILTNDIGIAVRGDLFMKVYIHQKNYRRRIGHHYFSCSIWNTCKKKLRNADIVSYALLLPLYDTVDMDSSNRKWTMITSDWQDITAQGDFRLPKVYPNS